MITYDNKTNQCEIRLDGRTPEALYAAHLSKEGFYVAVDGSGRVIPPDEKGSGTVFLAGMEDRELKNDVESPHRHCIKYALREAYQSNAEHTKARKSGLLKVFFASCTAVLALNSSLDHSPAAIQEKAKTNCDAKDLASVQASVVQQWRAVPSDHGYIITVQKTDADAKKAFEDCMTRERPRMTKLRSRAQSVIYGLEGAIFLGFAGAAGLAFRRSTRAKDDARNAITEAVAMDGNQRNIAQALSTREMRVGHYQDPTNRDFILTIVS